MIGKEGPSAGPDSQENYEAAVLDFLDREIADVQPAQCEKKQSEELDAIVADLMKQVLTESDRPQMDTSVGSDDLKDLLSEFPPQEESPAVQGKAASQPETEFDLSQLETLLSKPDSEKETAVSPESPETAEPEAAESYYSTPAIFKLAPAARRKMPLIAAAVVGLVVIAAAAFYLFRASPKKELTTAASQPAASVTTVTPDKTEEIPAPVQPVAKTNSQKTVSADSGKKPAETASSKPAPAAVVQKSPAARQAAPPTPAVTNPLSTPIVGETKPAAPQAVPPAPAVMPTPVAEKPVPPPASENAAPSSSPVERKPVQPVAAAPAGVENSTPPPRPQTPVPAAPAALVPAVPISQVSPKYPEFALRTRTSGQVVLELDVDSQGNVTKATPISGPEMFYKEAISAAMKWRYKPASIGGSSVSSQVKATFNFNLK